MSKFQTGDVVKYVGPGNWSKEHIIYKVVYQCRGRFDYTTNKGAWFVESDFELIRKADSQSLAQLDKDLFYEDDEELYNPTINVESI